MTFGNINLAIGHMTSNKTIISYLSSIAIACTWISDNARLMHD